MNLQEQPLDSDSHGRARQDRDKFPVAAYQMTFIFCIATLVIGAVAMYFTIDTQALLRKKEG